MRKDRKRLAVDIPIQLHHRLKKESDKRNVTITRMVIRSLIRELI